MTFEPWLERWGLTPAPIVTATARLLPVRQGGRAAMLKVATEPEERFGGGLMTWHAGRGAAQVLAVDGDALLLERATGGRSLAALARGGRDDAATGILCDVLAELHAPRAGAPPEGVPLGRRFRALAPAAAAHGGVLALSAAAARVLLDAPLNVGVLHGDVHHGNVLDFGARGWLAIDPKRLEGERGFDYANLFCNPDIDDPTSPVAVWPERFERRLGIVVARSGLERRRLLRWILAWAGLSAAWAIADGGPPEASLRVAALAVAALER